MRRKGRPPAWTPEQRERVLALKEEGKSQRAIAEQVFGDAGFRGRVERILRERAPRLDSAPGSADLAMTFDAGEALAALDVTGVRQLVARFERALHESEEVPALADVERLLRVKRQLDTMETLERLRALYQDSR